MKLVQVLDISVAFTLTLTLLTFWPLAVVASVDDLYQSIQSLNQDLGAVKDSLNVDSMGFLAALGINTHARNLDGSIQSATQEAINVGGQGVLGEDWASYLIGILQPMEADVEDIVNNLLRLKPQFDNLGVTSLASDDIASLHKSVAFFAAALVNLAPYSLQNEAQNLASAFNYALARAAEAYGVGS